MLSIWFLFVFGVDKVVFCQCTDTIISWRDPERSTELALSFQETAGCSYVWLVKKFLPLSMSIRPTSPNTLDWNYCFCNIQGSNLQYATKFAFRLSEQ